jgi:hypothetical protein
MVNVYPSVPDRTTATSTSSVGVGEPDHVYVATVEPPADAFTPITRFVPVSDDTAGFAPE